MARRSNGLQALLGSWQCLMGAMVVMAVVLTANLVFSSVLLSRAAMDGDEAFEKNENFKKMVVQLMDTQFKPLNLDEPPAPASTSAPTQPKRLATQPTKEPPRTFVGDPPVEVFDLTLHAPADVVPLLAAADLDNEQCRRMLKQRDSLWPDGMGSPRQLSVMLLGIGLVTVKERARQVGGPMGEFVFFMSTANALLCAGHRVTVIDTVEQLQNVSVPWSTFDAFYTERNWIGTPEVFKTFGIAEKWPCRARFLDFYGISARFVPEPYSARQVLTTYPWTTGNDFVGLAIRDRPTAADVREREPFGLIWGKEPKYFARPNVVRLLAALNNTRLVATINKIKLSHAPDLHLPPNIENLGTMERSELLQLFRRCTFVLGLGDPVLGPTGMEAVANGAVFLNPLRKERTASYNWDDAMDSQHPYLGSLGKPWVYTYDMDEPEKLPAIIDEIMRNSLTAPHPLKDFTLEAMATKLIANIVDPTVCPPRIRAEILSGASP